MYVAYKIMKQNIIIALLFTAFLGILFLGGSSSPNKILQGEDAVSENSDSAVLPIVWGDIGKQLVDTGVIDADRFALLYANRGGLSEEDKRMLSGENGAIVITEENSGVLLNLFWALGLGNKNRILESGPMADPRYGGAGGFASTGGWTLARGNSMEHYSRHEFVVLTEPQQELVERVSKNIYRPCCDNSTYFPDCNHGMAMLGFLELMASQGKSEEEMYRSALTLNRYWFPDTYEAIGTYLSNRGVQMESADPKVLLGADFSSGSGYQRILSEITPPAGGSSGSCGV